MATNEVADPEVDGIAWDLDPLLDGAGEGAAGVESLLDDAQRRADAFAAEHAGKVAALDGAGLAAAMRELAALQELIGRAGSFAMLSFSTATADPERGALLQLVQERATQIETTLLFFELEWAALDDERADALLAHDDLEFCRHHLRTARRYRPHLLSEPEERILAEKALTSQQRLDAPVRGADRRDRGPAAGRRRARRARDRALAPLLPRPRRAAQHRGGRDRRARARAARPRLRAQHAARGEDGRRPAALLPALARRPQPRQRGVRRVGRRARRRRPRPLRAGAPLVPAQGEAARHRPARRL